MRILPTSNVDETEIYHSSLHDSDGEDHEYAPVWLISFVGFCIAGLIGGILVGTAFYLYRDELFSSLILRQNYIQHTYEDKVAEMRIQIDDITSRQLLNQEAFEQQIKNLVERQKELELEAEVVSEILKQSSALGILKDSEIASADAFLKKTDAPSLNFINISYNETPRRGDYLRNALAALSPAKRVISPQIQVSAVKERVMRFEETLKNSIKTVAKNSAQTTEKLTKIAKDLNLPVSSIMDRNLDARGGPLILAVETLDNHFTQTALELDTDLTRLQNLADAFETIPLQRPLSEKFRRTSNYGYRSDPFTKQKALHSGIDFRGPVGQPIYATASGTVMRAGVVGGYGKLVEIRHAFGYKTRYAHLSAISVKVGQRVDVGDQVGKLGNTGRSTGPHLHYEVRISDKSVDPQKFLTIGSRIANAMN